MDYQTVLSVLGIGIANVVALWRMNRDLKQDLKNDVNNLRQDTKNDINDLLGHEGRSTAPFPG